MYRTRRTGGDMPKQDCSGFPVFGTSQWRARAPYICGILIAMQIRMFQQPKLTNSSVVLPMFRQCNDSEIDGHDYSYWGNLGTHVVLVGWKKMAVTGKQAR
ncbi:hypothetical protein CPB86DRAFT_795434 [Serendipita vermifera]|nr:hypothetical protein CPB86DRAFT_795434 [Serendipita vermifera]